MQHESLVARLQAWSQEQVQHWALTCPTCWKRPSPCESWQQWLRTHQAPAAHCQSNRSHSRCWLPSCASDLSAGFQATTCC